MKRLWIIVWVLMKTVTYGQSSLSVSQAQQIALENNYQVQIARNDALAARYNNTAGNAGALPTVDLSLRDQESNTDIEQRFSNGTVITRNGNASNSLSGNASVGYVLFNGFKIQATKKRLSSLQSAGEQQLLAQLQSTAWSTTVRYFDIVRQKSYRTSLEKSQEYAIKKMEIIRQRREVGLANDADLFQAQIDVNTAEQNLAEQDLLIRKAEVELSVLMNVPPDSIMPLSDSIQIDRGIRLDSVQRFIDNNPGVLAAQAQREASEQMVREIRSQRLPSLKLDGGYSYSRTVNEAGFSLFNRFNGPSVGATLQVPLYRGGSIKSQEKIASLDASNARITEDRTRQLLEADALTAFVAYQTSLSQLDNQEESYRLAGQVMDIQLQRYGIGQTTILDLRAAQLNFEETAAALIKARYIAKVAELELRRLSGAMLF